MTLTRDKLVERIARAMWEATYCDGWSWAELVGFAEAEGHKRQEWAIGNVESFRQKAAASVSAIESAGLCIVPREPTPPMVAAGGAARLAKPDADGCYAEAWFMPIYRAMIAAAGEG